MIVQGQAVADWVAEGTGAKLTADAQAIGLVTDGKLVAGVVYDCWTGTNIFCHQRIIGKTTKEYWEAIVTYPFITLECNRVTVTVNADNTKSIRIVEHMGFVEEGRMTGANSKGGDVIYYVLWKQDCKILNWKNYHGK